MIATRSEAFRACMTEQARAAKGLKLPRCVTTTSAIFGMTLKYASFLTRCGVAPYPHAASRVWRPTRQSRVGKGRATKRADILCKTQNGAKRSLRGRGAGPGLALWFKPFYIRNSARGSIPFARCVSDNEKVNLIHKRTFRESFLKFLAVSRADRRR